MYLFLLWYLIGMTGWIIILNKDHKDGFDIYPVDICFCFIFGFLGPIFLLSVIIALINAKEKYL